MLLIRPQGIAEEDQQTHMLAFFHALCLLAVRIQHKEAVQSHLVQALRLAL